AQDRAAHLDLADARAPLNPPGGGRTDKVDRPQCTGSFSSMVLGPLTTRSAEKRRHSLGPVGRRPRAGEGVGLAVPASKPANFGGVRYPKQLLNGSRHLGGDYTPEQDRWQSCSDGHRGILEPLRA